MSIRLGGAVWERAGLAAILVLAAGLRLWGLGGTGYGNSYYAAGVRSMLVSWRNFLFASFDPVGFVSLDKPPVAFWVQAAFAKLLGFSAFSILLPQALAGVATVAVLYHLVRRVFGPGAALLAAFTLAVMPLSVAVDRVNNTDSLLVLVLVLAAWPMVRAAETGRLSLLLLGLALLGVAFNVKMLAAYVVLPAFVLLYLLTAPLGWRTRLGHLAVGAMVLVAVSWSWALVVDLTPPGGRPYVGDSRNNTEMDLILGYNGIARLVAGTRWGGSRDAAAGTQGAATTTTASAPAGSGPAFPAPNGGFGGGEPGLLRLANRQLAAQITWLFPLAAMGLLAGARPSERESIFRQRQTLFLWGVWLLSGAIVFSFVRGMFRPFYIVTLAPALAALVGAGVVALWADYRGAGWRRALLPASLLLTAAWQASILREYPDWGRVLVPCVVAGSLFAAAVLLVGLARPGETRPHTAAGALAMGLLWLLISPAAWAVTPVVRGGGGVPTAGPDAIARGQRRGWVARGDADVQRLVGFLRSQRRGERYLVATVNAMQASPIIIQTAEPVIAIGGWSGGDPILTVDQFAMLVAEGQIRYVLVPERDGEGLWGGRAGANRNADLVGWVRDHGRPVDPALWRAETAPSDDSSLAPLRAGRRMAAGAPGGRRRAWRGGSAGRPNYMTAGRRSRKPRRAPGSPRPPAENSRTGRPAAYRVTTRGRCSLSRPSSQAAKPSRTRSTPTVRARTWAPVQRRADTMAPARPNIRGQTDRPSRAPPAHAARHGPDPHAGPPARAGIRVAPWPQAAREELPLRAARLASPRPRGHQARVLPTRRRWPPLQ